MSENLELNQLAKKRFYYVANWIALSYLISLVAIAADAFLNGFNHGSLINQLCIICIVALVNAIKIVNSNNVEHHENKFYTTFDVFIEYLLQNDVIMCI